MIIAEKDDNSKVFTIIYVIFCSSIVNGVLGVLVTQAVYSRVKLVPNQNNHGSMSLTEVGGNLTFMSVLRYIWFESKVTIGWYTHRSRVILVGIFLFWMALGTAYGVTMEGWTVITSLYWAVTSCSTGGLQSPACIDGTDGTTCDFGQSRAVLMATYMAIGIPIYAVTVSCNCI